MCSGRLVLKVEGENLNKFLNMLIFNKILLKLYSKQNNTIIIGISTKIFKKVIKIAKRTKCKISILEKNGMYFYLKELTLWKVITVGVCIFILIVFNQFIFDIAILNHGSADMLLNEKIKEKLYQYNIKPFILKNKIDEKILERKLLTELGDLMWVNVKKEGVRLFVEYVKREMAEIENKKGRIFAASSGIIKRIILKSGNLLVKEGDTVVYGQLLVDNKVFSKDGIEYFEDANAQIEAITFYTVPADFTIPLYQKEYISKATVPYIKVGNYEIKLKNIVTKNENCDKIKIKEYKLSPLAIWVGVYEVKRYKLKRFVPTFDQIKEKAKRECDQKFMSLTKNKKILNVLSVRTYIKVIKQKGEIRKIECQRNYECLEEIGVKK
ncbi:stage IV sporulation YqfD [Caldicellulosiruptor kronotskyensis 2002]|uniref:Stage IV sporulation YqfD n=1 Tax=Caldicellulosiruptor kronotskyensis (strain DSM 18902 / VKM B-2412 / 2002) TaxID=632348 RepID=E4SC51_CALK2|nr:sporulation protein YqfD [Caldicellulosiruptor kronotskyensis]ADQ46286.1 stage IV sporulation YqfD [Caldicellulosiruptor kronotskyensis 2002]